MSERCEQCGGIIHDPEDGCALHTIQEEAEKVADNILSEFYSGEPISTPRLKDLITQALTKARQEARPDCTSSTRCITCYKCEARIVKRQKEIDAGVAENWYWLHSYTDDEKKSWMQIAQAIRESS